MTDQDGEVELGALLRAAFAQYRELATASISELGLTALQARALQQLDGNKALSSKQLAAALGVEPPNLTALVDKLVDAGLIERAVDEHDRRVKLLLLTPAGADMRRRVTEHLRQSIHYFDDLTSAQRGQLARLLRRVTARDPGPVG